MRIRGLLISAVVFSWGLMGATQVLAQSFKLWGSQKDGSSFSGPKMEGNTVTLTRDAKITRVERHADGFTVFRGGALYVTVQKGHELSGVLPPGEYTLRTDIGSVSIHLDTQFNPENVLLWGKQTAVVSPRWEGNFLVLAGPTPIVDAFYDGTDGMGIFPAGSNRAFLQYISPHNIHNPGPKVIDASGRVVADSLVGLTLPAGVYSLTPGRGTADGIVQGRVVLAVGAVAGGPNPGWQAVADGGNQVEIGPDQICIYSMRHGKGYATQPRFYDFSQDYTIEFDFRLEEKNNHWFILYSDSFVHLHIDWGTDLFFISPANTKITNLDVGRWYHFRIDAYPGRQQYRIDIDGRSVASAANVTPGTIDVGADLGTSGIDGALGEWIYIGDDQNTEYDRGSACWKHLTISAGPAEPVQHPSVVRLFSEVPKQGSAAFRSNTYPSVRIATGAWDPVPYHMAPPFTGTVTVDPQQMVMLAGDENGTRPWSIDNFLLFEISSSSGTNRFVVGTVEPVSFDGQGVPQVGPSGFSFSPGSLDLTDLFPKGEPVELKVSALDYGGVGGVSDVYLIIK